MYPLNLYTKWDRNNYGPIWIPKKGATIKLTEDNLPIYERPIRAYEGNTLEVKEDGIYINGKKTDEYTFKMDYYWNDGMTIRQQFCRARPGDSYRKIMS